MWQKKGNDGINSGYFMDPVFTNTCLFTKVHALTTTDTHIGQTECPPILPGKVGARMALVLGEIIPQPHIF